MQQLGMGQAVNQALREEMTRDARVFLAGEGVGVSIHDNPMLPTAGLLMDFGSGRVKDTPVSEAAIAGLSRRSRDLLQRFVSHLASTPLIDLQRDYVATFDLKRRCCLYLTYYLNGDTRRRGHEQGHDRRGQDRGADADLPQHLPA